MALLVDDRQVALERRGGCGRRLNHEHETGIGRDLRQGDRPVPICREPGNTQRDGRDALGERDAERSGRPGRRRDHAGHLGHAGITDGQRDGLELARDGCGYHRRDHAHTGHAALVEVVERQRARGRAGRHELLHERIDAHAAVGDARRQRARRGHGVRRGREAHATAGPQPVVDQQRRRHRARGAQPGEPVLDRSVRLPQRAVGRAAARVARAGGIRRWGRARTRRARREPARLPRPDRLGRAQHLEERILDAARDAARDVVDARDRH